jgi:hypothetical protein
MNMEILGVLALFGLIFAAIISLPIWRIWRKLRVIAVAIPAGSDPQVLRYKLTEAIRSFGYRAGAEAGPAAQFRAPAWQKWAVGLQDISVEPSGGGAVLVTGPARDVSRIGRTFAGATAQTYNGRQPVWPLFKGFMKMFAVLLVVSVATIGTVALFAN